MALTTKRCEDHIAHALSNGLPDKLSTLDLVNDVGEYFCSPAHGWRWLQVQVATLDLVAGQDYATLPADFGRTIKLEMANALTSTILYTTPADWLELKNRSFAGTLTFFATILFAHPAAGGPPVPRLMLFPTPNTDGASAISLLYEAKWRRPTTDDEALVLPEYCEGLFLELCRAYAVAYEENADALVTERLAAVRGGPLWEAAQARDAMVQDNYGTLRNGVGSVGVESDYWYWRDRDIANPS